jgi:hypothetical protein
VQPYVIRQGDHLCSLAYRYGFDADTVWSHPKNAELRDAQNLSPDPNALNPTDVLYIPDAAPPDMQDLNTGSTNTFVVDVPTEALNVTFTQGDGTPYASMSFTVQELPDLTGLATNGAGLATFQVPVTLKAATVVFSDSGASFVLAIGQMDPIDSLSGIFKRLVNLGYIDSSIEFDSSQLDVFREGLHALKAVTSAGDGSPPSSQPPDSAPPSSSAPDSTPASGGAPDSTPASGAAPDSSPASDPGDGACDAGLSDDGTLDADTRSLLLEAYGS